MHKTSYYVVNGITLYRLVMAPVLVCLLFFNKIDLFKWLLAVSFSTDAIDGFLARKLKVSSDLGSKLDSIADDLTILAAVIGLFVLKKEFIKDNVVIVSVLLGLFILQNVMALIKYHKPSSFHTYLAKGAALVQGSFLILVFLLPEPIYPLFYAAVVISILDLIEETLLVIIIPKWRTNVKGIYWVMKERKGEK